MKEGARRLWRGRLVRVALLAAMVALTIFLVSIREQAQQLAAYGYPGIFALSILTNATLVLPMPGLAITFAAGAIFHPLWVGLIAGAGATLGELTGFTAGLTGHQELERVRLYKRMEGLTRRYGGWAILVIAFIPNPFFDLAGAAAGALGMPVSQFLLWSWIGKTLKMLVVAYAGASSAIWVLDYLQFNP